MKTNKNQIKTIVMLFILACSLNVIGQNVSNESRIFIRVYNLEGKKVNKGQFQFINDSVLGIRQSGKLVELDIKEIGLIKTKRSPGHNVLVGGASGVVAGAILGSLNSPTDSSGGTFTWAGGSRGDELASGLTVGILSGTVIGGITALFKNSETFIIDGDINNLKAFAEMIIRKH